MFKTAAELRLVSEVAKAQKRTQVERERAEAEAQAQRDVAHIQKVWVPRFLTVVKTAMQEAADAGLYTVLVTCEYSGETAKICTNAARDALLEGGYTVRQCTRPVPVSPDTDLARVTEAYTLWWVEVSW